MGNLSQAIYESFNIDEDFAEEVAETADESVEEMNESIDDPFEKPSDDTVWDKVKDDVTESLTEGSIWDKIAPALQENVNESLWDEIIEKVPDLNESLNESQETSDISRALDQFYDLTNNQDIPPKRAKAMILGEESMQESLKESNLREAAPVSYKEKYDPNKHMQKVVEKYMKEARWPADTKFTEDMLKNEDWRIKNVAMRGAVPSSALKEALLEGIKNED